MRWRALAFALAFVATAGFAGTTTDGPVAAGGSAAAPGTMDGTAAAGLDQAWCPIAGDMGAGVHVVGIEHDGMTRSYEAHVPTSYDGAVPVPMVVALHGFASGPAEMAEAAGLGEVALFEGFVVVYPEGFQGSWNSGGCCGAASIAGVDDVGFVVAAARDAAARFCVDTDRTYLVGTASGEDMAGRIALERPGVFAAIATLSGSDPIATGDGAMDSLGAADAAWQAWDSLSDCCLGCGS